MNLLPVLTFYILVCFTGGLAQDVVLVGGETHTPESTIQTNFSMRLVSGIAYTIVLKFNDISVCYIPIPRGSITTPYCNSTTDTTYYNNNSAVTSATLDPTTLDLQAVFMYSNAMKEDGTIIVSVINGLSGTEYGEKENLIVTGCADQDNANYALSASNPTYCNDNYNYYDCRSTFSCADGYSGAGVTATCQADATWSNTIFCVSETTVASTTLSTDPESTTPTTTETETEDTTMETPNTSNTDIVNNISTVRGDASTMGSTPGNVTDATPNSTIMGRSGGGPCYSCAAIALGLICMVEIIVLIIGILKFDWTAKVWMVTTDAVSSCITVVGVGMSADGASHDGCLYGTGTAGIVLGSCGVAALLVGILLHSKDPSCSCCAESCVKEVSGNKSGYEMGSSSAPSPSPTE